MYRLFSLLVGFFLGCYTWGIAQTIPSQLTWANTSITLDEGAKTYIQNQVKNWLADTKNFKQKVHTTQKFLPLVQKIFKKERLPEDLALLAIVQNPTIDSVILWHNMPLHLLNRFKFRQDDIIDESQNPIHTTQATARYLRENAKLLDNNWLQVALSYVIEWNRLKELIENKADFMPITIGKQAIFTDKTHQLLLKVIAYKIASEHLNPNTATNTEELVALPNDEKKPLLAIAKDYLLSVAKIKRYNRWLKSDILPTDKIYYLLVPLPSFSPSVEGEPLAQAPPSEERVYQAPAQRLPHVVAKGETVYKIAQKYKVRMTDIYQWNNLNPTQELAVGQELYVSPPTTTLPVTYAQEKKITPPATAFVAEAVVQNTTFHVVAKGENLYSIAKKYNVLASELMRSNKLSNTQLQVGQQLRIVRTIAQNDKVAKPASAPIPIKPIPQSTMAMRPVSAKKVPREMMLLDTRIKISEKAQALIQHDVNVLTKNTKYFHEKLERANWYLKLIEETLIETKVPMDFKYLPIQESTLLPNVVSVSNAVGYWQFKDGAAREVGLTINAQIDERLNIVSATDGAAKYLKRNNLYFKNWVFTLLSYNLGFTGAKKFLEQYYDEDEVIGAKCLIIDETMHWYVRKFIAHKIAFEDELGKDLVSKMLVPYDKATNKTLSQIAQETQTNLKDLQWHNQWLKTGRVPANKNYTIILPQKR